MRCSAPLSLVLLLECTYLYQACAFSPPALPPAPPPAGAGEKAYESIIRQTVQGVIVAALHPRTLIQIVLQVGP